MSTNNDNNNGGVGFVVCFALLAGASCVSMVSAVYNCRRPIYNRHTVRILFPWASFCMICENATMAASGSGNIPRIWMDVVKALEATVAPSLLMSTFDVAYIIHKTRHVRFMGIWDGQASAKNPRISFTIKLCMRIVAIAELVLGLLVNFNVGFSPPSAQAGNVGWYTVVTELFDLQVVLSLIPMAVTCITCFYFALMLWKYGTTSSMVVHSSPLNPWFSPFFGTLGLTVGQWFGARLFPLLSNVGIFIFIGSILFLVLEVNKDLRAAVELNVFLGAFDDLRKSEVQHYQDYAQQDEEEEIVFQERLEVSQGNGDVIVVEEEEIKQTSDDDDKITVDKDKVKRKKGKVVEFAEETTEIVPVETEP